MTEQQEQLTQAIEGAIIGIAAASDNYEITPIQIYALLNNLFNQLKATLH